MKRRGWLVVLEVCRGGGAAFPEKADVLERRCCWYLPCPVCLSPHTSAAAAKGFAPKVSPPAPEVCAVPLNPCLSVE